MKCKFCLAELDDDVTVCPACGKNLEETAEETVEETAEELAEVVDEPEKKLPKTLMITLAAVGGVILATALTLAVLYGMGIKMKSVSMFFGFTEADITYKNSYTVSDKKVDKKADVVIAKVGNQTLTNEDLQVYYWMTVRDFVDYYGYYLGSIGLDTSKPLNEQIEESSGKNYQQYFLENALETWRRYASLVQMAEDANYTLDKELQDYLATFETEMNKLAIEAGYADGEDLVDKSVSTGSSMAAYYKYVKTEYTALGYYNSLEERLRPTMEEMEAYYTANEETLKSKGYGKEKGNYYDVRHILVEIEGEGTQSEDGKTVVYTDEQWEACRAKAQKMLDDFLANEPTEEKFAELAKKESADPGSASNGGLYEMLTKNYGFIENFENWYIDESRKAGDTGLVQNTQSSVQGYHIMYFSGSMPIWEYQVETLVRSEKTNKLLEDADTQWPMEVNYKKIVLGDADLTTSS